jgi:hypothetical protein
MRATTARTVPTVETAPVESSRHHPYLTTAILTAIPFAVAILALQTCDEAHRAWFAEEDDVAENLQVVFLLIATWAAGSVALGRWRRSEPLVGRAFAALAVGAVFVAGEEISWAQRLFGIATPEAVAEVNIQQELTLHNTYLLTPVFSFAQLFVGFLPALAALTPWQRLLPPRWDAWRRALVPGPALASWFLLIGAWRLYRYAFMAPDTPAWIGEFSEIPELVLYAGLALFALDQRRYVRVARERLA